MRSLWRIKLEASVWITLFAAVFFVAFFTLRVHFTNGFPDTLNGVMQPSEWGMAITCALTFLCTFLFSKIYYAFNPDLHTSHTQMLKSTQQDVSWLKKAFVDFDKEMETIKDLLLTLDLPSEEEP